MWGKLKYFFSFCNLSGSFFKYLFFALNLKYFKTNSSPAKKTKRIHANRLQTGKSSSPLWTLTIFQWVLWPTDAPRTSILNLLYSLCPLRLKPPEQRVWGERGSLLELIHPWSTTPALEVELVTFWMVKVGSALVMVLVKPEQVLDMLDFEPYPHWVNVYWWKDQEKRSK